MSTLPTMSSTVGRAGRDLGAQLTLDLQGEPWRDRACALCLDFFRVMGEDGCLFEGARHYAIVKGIEEPSSPNAWGALVLFMSKRGLIKRTGRWEQSLDARSHARMQPKWRLA